MIKVKNRMSQGFYSLPTGVSVMEVAKLLADKKIGSIFIKEGEDVAGIITETDLVRKILAKSLDPEKEKVETHMVTRIISIDLNETLTEAGDIMAKHRIRHLGVTEDGKIVGVLSVRALIHPVYTDGEGW